MNTPEQPTLRTPRVRRWLAHLWREWTIESWRPISPAFAKPEPLKWNNAHITAAWIGHSTVLINFFGINILTDPVLFSRIGIRLPGFTIGPKRLTAPANFKRNDDGGHSYVYKQPETPEEEGLCKEAMEGCPVEAIGNDGNGA